MERCQARYGETFSLEIAAGGRFVFITNPDAIKEVFTGDPSLLHAGEANAILEPVVGRRSVLLLDGPTHMRQRKLMLPPLHGERMQGYGELMADIAHEEIDSWPQTGEIAVGARMQGITLEIIMRAVFGVEEGARLDRLRTVLRDMMDWVAKPTRMLVVASIGPERFRRYHDVTGFSRVIKPVNDLLLDEVARRRTAEDLEERSDILSLLLTARDENGEGLSDGELRDELVTLLVAGHETTATALSWALERLVRHPAALERLEEETRAGEEAYADAVVTETLRLRPVLPIVNRRLKAPMNIAGYDLPEGINVAPCIYLTHRREDLYPEPAAFRPERFLGVKPGTYSWIPFGGGTRRCLGASFALFEMRQVLQAVVSRVRLAAPDDGSERVRRRAITFAPERGGSVRVADKRPRESRAAVAA
jgi:cytochrome P450